MPTPRVPRRIEQVTQTFQSGNQEHAVPRARLDHYALALGYGLEGQSVNYVTSDAMGRTVDAVVPPELVVYKSVLIDECKRVDRQVLKGESCPQLSRNSLLCVAIGEVVIGLLIVIANGAEDFARIHV